jgi:hypothetical protein
MLTAATVKHSYYLPITMAWKGSATFIIPYRVYHNFGTLFLKLFIHIHFHSLVLEVINLLHFPNRQNVTGRSEETILHCDVTGQQ